MNTNLATIQVITDLQPISGADKIETATIMGWKVVVKKDEFKIGDKCCYVQIDTILPDKPEFDFLRKVNFRIKTIRLKKQLSQGIAFPLSTLPNYERENNGMESCNDGTSARLYISVGKDVTDILGVKKYEKPIPLTQGGDAKGGFPSYISKTDETNIQSILPVLDEIMGKEVYITVKCDGTSGTFANFNGEVDVCSRNISWKESEENIYWKMYHKYNMSKIFADMPNFSIQGELVGPGIQKNPMGLKELDLFVFNVYDIKAGKYLGYFEMQDFCKNNGLKTVPLLQTCTFNFTLDQLLEMAKGKYESGKNREGIVIRPVVETYSKTIDENYGMAGRLSFKILNNDYLEKDED